VVDQIGEDKEKRKKSEEKREKRSGQPIGMPQKCYILSMCTLVPREVFGLRNWMEYFVKLGPKKIWHQNGAT
jgi:hypothetical protein